MFREQLGTTAKGTSEHGLTKWPPAFPDLIAGDFFFFFFFLFSRDRVVARRYLRDDKKPRKVGN